MKPLDNDEGAASVAATAVDEGSGARVSPSSGFAPTDDAVETPRGQSDVVSAFQHRRDSASASARVSGVVPLGTTTEERVNDAAEAPDSSSMRPSDVVPRSPSPHENRAAVRVAELAMTRAGPSFGLDEDDEATTVDATAGLAFEEREALVQRIHSAMEETLPVGTPPPAPVQPTDDAEAARERRIAFKQTMLLGVAKRETPAPPAPVAGDERALLASKVRVVGPPTQPPPRRSRRISAVPSAAPSEADAVEHPDHEAFSLMHAIVTPEAPKKVVPDAAPPPTAPSLSISASRSSLPGVMLPPAPEPRDYEADAAIGSAPAPSSLRGAFEPLRATIEPPSSLARTRPPLTRRAAEPPALEELPLSDPFAGFVAPPPSLFQRWLVVIVVALAVVGLCSLADIAFGFLGKTGW